MQNSQVVAEMRDRIGGGWSRRDALAFIAAGATALTMARAARAACVLTPSQIDGPYYPLTVGTHDADMTSVSGASQRAAGQVIEVTGRVRDAQCQPISGCVLEIWQADASGHYNHPGDEDGRKSFDRNFQGYARIVTDADGAYRILTVKPAPYPTVVDGWVRTPHIHFKAHTPFNPNLTTQMYFAGEPLNAPDRLYAALDDGQRKHLEVSFENARADGVPTGRFDIFLQNV